MKAFRNHLWKIKCVSKIFKSEHQECTQSGAYVICVVVDGLQHALQHNFAKITWERYPPINRSKSTEMTKSMAPNLIHHHRITSVLYKTFSI